jgi:hypothetical protein
MSDDPENLDELLDLLPARLRRRVLEEWNEGESPVQGEVKLTPAVDWPLPPLPPPPPDVPDLTEQYRSEARAHFAHVKMRRLSWLDRKLHRWFAG